MNELLIPGLELKENLRSKRHDEIEEKHPVIIAGFGHFGSTIGRFLRANGIEATILDHDSDRVSASQENGI